MHNKTTLKRAIKTESLCLKLNQAYNKVAINARLETFSPNNKNLVEYEKNLNMLKEVMQTVKLFAKENDLLSTFSDLKKQQILPVTLQK